MVGCIKCGQRIVLRRSKRLRLKYQPKRLIKCINCSTVVKKKNRVKIEKGKEKDEEQILKKLSDTKDNVTDAEDESNNKQTDPCPNESSWDNIYHCYPMGKHLKHKALNAGRKTSYTIVAFKYDEDSAVFLTNVDAHQLNSKRLTRKDINAIKEWLGSDKLVCNTLEGDIYMTKSQSVNGRVHIREKITHDFVYTYVPFELFFEI